MSMIFSARDRHILHQLSNGFRAIEIAMMLQVKQTTVHTQLYKARKRNGYKTNIQMASALARIEAA